MLRKEREFIVEESAVTEVISVISKYLKGFDGQVGTCGYEDQPNKWFVAFRASDKKYGRIVSELALSGDFKLKADASGYMDVFYEKFERAS